MNALSLVPLAAVAAMLACSAEQRQSHLDRESCQLMAKKDAQTRAVNECHAKGTHWDDCEAAKSINEELRKRMLECAGEKQ